MTRNRPLTKLLLALTTLLVLAGVSFIAFLQSDWLAQRLRQGVIDGVQDATGARVTIPEFRWNWRSLTVEMHGFTMRGFEPSSGSPLFTAPLVRVRLRILSLLSQQIEVSSLLVTRPRFNLIVGPNGMTNVPGPKHSLTPREIIENLLVFKLPYVEAKEGFAQINDQRFPVDLVANHISVLVQYRRTNHRYYLTADSPALRLGGNKVTYFNGSIQANGELWRNHFSLTSSHFHSHSSDFRISGTLDDFDIPVVDWHFASTFAASESLCELGIKGMTGGTIQLNGIGHHDPKSPLFIDAQLKANNLSASLPGLQLRNGTISSKLLADRSGLQFSDLLLSTSQGQFAGQGTFSAYRDLQVSGTLSRVDLQTVASGLLKKPLPWSASIAGPVQVTAAIGPSLSNLIVKGDLDLAPRSEGIPVSGDVHFLYNQREAELALHDSHVRFPHTHIILNTQPSKAVTFVLDSTNLSDLQPALALAEARSQSLELPSLAVNGSAHLQGVANFQAHAPLVEASLDLSHLQWQGTFFDRLRSNFTVSPSSLRLSSLSVEASLLHGSAVGQVALFNWQMQPSSLLQVSGSFSNANVDALLKRFSPQSASQLSGGSAAGSFDLKGSAVAPNGTAQFAFADFNVRGEHLDSARASLTLVGNQLTFTRGSLQSRTAALAFSGMYAHTKDHWDSGTLQLIVDTSRFPLARLDQHLAGQAELHADTSWAIAPARFAPLNLKGTAALHRVLWNGLSIGDLAGSVSTEGQLIKGELAGNFRGSKISGSTQFQIAPGTPAKGSISFDAISLESVMALLHSGQSPSPMLSGSARGSLAFDGPVETPAKLHALLELRDLQVKGPPLRTLGSELAGAPVVIKAPLEAILQNAAPVAIELTNGIANIRSARLTGRDTQFSITGTVGIIGDQTLRLALNGGVDLRLLQLLYPEVRFGGQTKIAAALTGTLLDPQLSGTLQLARASVFSPLLPNGLSDLGGTIRFDQHRATLEKITAHTGGGNVSFGGFITYSANRPFVYRLESVGQNVRIRYANGISVTANAQFSLTGTSEQSLLSGGITVSRIVLNPSADLGNLLALTSSSNVAVNNEKDYLSRLQMDIHVDSAPDLQLDTALSSDVQAGIDLRLRGTPKQPIILGSIEGNQGDIKIFGSRYSINRGQISFTNSARMEPVLDLDLQTQARGITVDITVSGTLNKLNINYRSDPPLQPREIIALLTVGRTPQTTASETNVQATNDANSLQSGANSVLGQAIAPVSNRLSKLFGITNIKIDPLVQGITNTPQARLTLEQQISRQITVTYITNLSQTSEQIFRLEYSLNPQFSLIALRDDNGEFGIDILYKKRFR